MTYTNYLIIIGMEPKFYKVFHNQMKHWVADKNKKVTYNSLQIQWAKRWLS